MKGGRLEANQTENPLFSGFFIAFELVDFPSPFHHLDGRVLAILCATGLIVVIWRWAVFSAPPRRRGWGKGQNIQRKGQIGQMLGEGH